jgi:hypothetical protein
MSQPLLFSFAPFLQPLFFVQSDGGSRLVRPSSGSASSAAVAAAVEAIKRSPLMLDVPATAPGLAKVAQLVSFLCFLFCFVEYIT